MIDPDGSARRRVAALGAVALLHAAILAALASGGMRLPARAMTTPMRLILERHVPPPSPAIPVRAPVPPPVFMPAPEIAIASPPAKAAPRAITRAPAAATAHFGAAADSGLGLDVGTLAGGGAGDRGSLARFEAAVRQRILSGKRQPALAWDRRNTCVVAYTVHIAAGGRLSGFTIDPCAVPEINEAARAAIRQGDYPAPPSLGSQDYAVHGSLVFKPG